MSLNQSMEEEIEFLPDPEPQPQMLDGGQGQEILQSLQVLPGLLREEIEPLRLELGRATDLHTKAIRKALEDLAPAAERLRRATEEAKTASAALPALTENMRREAARIWRESSQALEEAVASERAAIHRDLRQIPTVRRYFLMCLATVLITSAISVLVWQQSRPDPVTLKAAETFRLMWDKATPAERRQIEEIISRPREAAEPQRRQK